MKKLALGLSTVCVSVAFWACGSGDVFSQGSDEDTALAMYGPGTDAMGTLTHAAQTECFADEQCKAAMEGATDVVKPDNKTDDENESVQSSQSSENSSDSETPTPASSTTSTVTTPVSSSSVVAVVTPVDGSSSSTAVLTPTASEIKGNCMPIIATTSVVKGEPISWSFRTLSNSVKPTTYEWVFDEAGSPSMETSDASAPVMSFAKAGSYKATLTLDKGLETEKTVTCQSVSVVGPDVTGCTCGAPTLISATDKVGSGSPVTYEWTVSGCISADAEPFTYSWSGTGVTGNTETGVGSFTAMGQYGASVKVTNADGVSGNFTCSQKALVDDANWTFKCSPMNSAEFAVAAGASNNKAEAEVKAGGCYMYKPNSGYNASLQIGQWSGSAVSFDYYDCNGTVGKASLTTGTHTSVNVGYNAGKECMVYFYVGSNVNLQIQMW